MRFLEAEALARQKKAILPAEYYSAAGLRNRSKAFTVSGLTSLNQIEHVQKQLDSVLKEGWTMKEFREAVKADGFNIDLPDYRLNNIFRTNIQSAYNAGRLAQQYEARITHPYLMFSAVLDRRARDSHRALHGLILSWDDDVDLINRLYPPLDYQCRCSMISLTARQAGRYSDPEKQAQKKALTDIKTSKSFKSGPISTDDLERIYADRLAGQPFPVDVAEDIKIIRQDVGASTSTALKIENLTTSEISRVLGYEFQPANVPAEIRGEITPREAAIVTRARNRIDDLGRLVDLGQAAGNDKALLAAVDSLFDNRPALRWTPQRGNLYTVLDPGRLQAGQLVQALSFFSLSKSAGQANAVIKRGFGEIINIGHGEALARYGQWLRFEGSEGGLMIISIIDDANDSDLSMARAIAEGYGIWRQA